MTFSISFQMWAAYLEVGIWPGYLDHPDHPKEALWRLREGSSGNQGPGSLHGGVCGQAPGRLRGVSDRQPPGRLGAGIGPRFSIFSKSVPPCWFPSPAWRMCCCRLDSFAPHTHARFNPQERYFCIIVESIHGKTSDLEFWVGSTFTFSFCVLVLHW